MHIIVDGYNLLHKVPMLAAWGESGQMERARLELLRRLGEYARVRRHRVTVVFDGQGTGWGSPHPSAGTQAAQIAVVYSVAGEKADDLIRRMAARPGRVQTPAETLVVTSDAEVAHDAALAGVHTLRSEEFWLKVARTFPARLAAARAAEAGRWRAATDPMWAKASGAADLDADRGERRRHGAGGSRGRGRGRARGRKHAERERGGRVDRLL